MSGRTITEVLREAERMRDGSEDFKARFRSLVVDYVALTGVAPTRFGKDACKDGMLYDTVVGGTRPGRRSVSIEKMHTVLAYMADPANSMLR